MFFKIVQGINNKKVEKLTQPRGPCNGLNCIPPKDMLKA